MSEYKVPASTLKDPKEALGAEVGPYFYVYYDGADPSAANFDFTGKYFHPAKFDPTKYQPLSDLFTTDVPTPEDVKIAAEVCRSGYIQLIEPNNTTLTEKEILFDLMGKVDWEREYQKIRAQIFKIEMQSVKISSYNDLVAHNWGYIKVLDLPPLS